MPPLTATHYCYVLSLRFWVRNKDSRLWFVSTWLAFFGDAIRLAIYKGKPTVILTLYWYSLNFNKPITIKDNDVICQTPRRDASEWFEHSFTAGCLHSIPQWCLAVENSLPLFFKSWACTLTAGLTMMSYWTTLIFVFSTEKFTLLLAVLGTSICSIFACFFSELLPYNMFDTANCCCGAVLL